MLRASLIVCTTSFLIGTLTTHWIADGLTLWKSPLTDAHLYTSAAYYSLLAQMPRELAAVVSSVAVAGAATSLWSLWDGRAGNLMFDGASVFLYGCVFVVYVFSVLPNVSEHFATPLPASYDSAFPHDLKAPTLDLASSHLVCSVALTGVLVLQAGRWWAEGEDEAAAPSDAAPTVRTRRRAGTPVISTPQPPSRKRREGSVRQKRLSLTSSGSSGRR